MVKAQTMEQLSSDFLKFLEKIKNKKTLNPSLKTHKMYKQLKEIKEKIELDNSLIEYDKLINIVSKKELKQLIQEKILFKISKKYYCFDLEIIDNYVLNQILFPNTVFCCETVSNFLDISTHIDLKTNIMVSNKFKYWRYKRKYKNYKFFYSNKKSFSVGKTKHKSYMQNEIPIYDLEKTILDILNHQKNMNPQVIDDLHSFLENHLDKIDKTKMIDYINKINFFKKNKKEGVLYEWFWQKEKTI